MATKKKAEGEEKITRGYNLSRENVMWLTRAAFAETLKQEKGTVSASEMLDRIVTAARENEARVGRIARKINQALKVQ